MDGQTLAPGFKALGHEFVNFTPQETIVDLPELLDRHKLVPDLFIQREFLGRRVFLRGLERLPCPTVFWSLDTHLNLFWQRHAMRLFDGALTPHLSLLEAFPGPLPPFGRLARHAPRLPWRPFAERGHDVCFVGRLTEHRPVRRWLCEFLRERYHAAIAQDLSIAALFELYADSRLAPNEAICEEVNFRLLEAAGCGCLVLSQPTGPDQDALLEPGREIDIYTHVLELRDKLDHWLAHPAEAEAMARRAWERVQAEHLIVHRAAALLDFTRKLTPNETRRHAAEREQHWLLSLAEAARGDRVDLDPEALERSLTRLPQTPEVLAARLRLLAENGKTEALPPLLLGLLEAARPSAPRPEPQTAPPNPTPGLAHDIELLLAASMTALKLDQWPLAREFWRLGQAADERPRPLPNSPAELCLDWARRLARHGLKALGGWEFDPERHIPDTALTCLHLARHLAPDNPAIERETLNLSRDLPGNTYMALGVASGLHLRAPNDWRLGLRLALLNLRVNRLSQGVEELLAARDQALAQGKLESFLRALKGIDPSGSMMKMLKS